MSENFVELEVGKIYFVVVGIVSFFFNHWEWNWNYKLFKKLSVYNEFLVWREREEQKINENRVKISENSQRQKM